MKKNEIAKAKDSELVYEYVQKYSSLCLNYNLGRATKQLQIHCNNLEEELVKRGLLTEEDVAKLNS
jgi:hypothetical protein